MAGAHKKTDERLIAPMNQDHIPIDEDLDATSVEDNEYEVPEDETSSDLRDLLARIDRRIKKLCQEVTALEKERQSLVEDDYARRQQISSAANHSGRAQEISRLLREDPWAMKTAESRQFAQMRQELALTRLRRSADGGKK